MNKKALFGSLSALFALACIVCTVQFDNNVAIALSVAGGIATAVMLYLTLNIQTDATRTAVVEALTRQQLSAEATLKMIEKLISISSNIVAEATAIKTTIGDSASKATVVLYDSLQQIKEATTTFENIFPQLTELQATFANSLATSFTDHIQKQTEHISSVHASFTSGLEVLEKKQNDMSKNVAVALEKTTTKYSELTSEYKELCTGLSDDLEDINEQFEEFLKSLKSHLENYTGTAEEFNSTVHELKRGVARIGDIQEDFSCTFSEKADDFNNKLKQIAIDFNAGANGYKESIDRQQRLQKEDSSIIERILNGK
jgi:rubrerythrin